jgi:hypothetical protein
MTFLFTPNRLFKEPNNVLRKYYFKNHMIFYLIRSAFWRVFLDGGIFFLREVNWINFGHRLFTGQAVHKGFIGRQIVFPKETIV